MKCTYLSFVLYVFHDIFIQRDFHIRWCSCHLSVRKVYDTKRSNINP